MFFLKIKIQVFCVFVLFLLDFERKKIDKIMNTCFIFIIQK